ncbi:MAG TPA: hypothetical protein P5223_14780 [Phycisphaerae bacterium]|nr:hypothetical protein [Phycisphaerae bacterium]
MTILFPASLDSLTNPAATDSRIGHAAQHADVNDAIEAIEAQIGTTAAPVLARLGGVAGGQTLNGGTAASETLTLASTAHATKGKINLGAASAYDELAARLGVGTLSPSAKIHGLATTEQLRLGYDVANYLSATVAASGVTTFAATGGTIIIQGTAATDGPTLGGELLTTAGWTVPGGWTESPDDVFTHANGGGANALSHSATIANSTKHQISWTISGRTTGSVTFAVGGQSLATQTASGIFGPTTTSTSGLVITPTNDFDGVLSSVSLRQITSGSTALVQGKTSGAVSGWEIRACGIIGNTFFGTQAGQFALSQSGAGLTAIGQNALPVATTALRTTAVGRQSGFSVSTSKDATLIGVNAGFSLTTGSQVSALGATAAFSITTGTDLTAVGFAAGYSLTSSTGTCIGSLAGRYQADGSTALTTAPNCTYVGYSAKGLNDSDSYSIVIGANAVGLGANTTVLGTINQTTAATIYGAGTHSLTDATTNAAVTVETLTKNVTGAGVGAAGLGPRLVFAAESSTTNDTQQADITATWTDATHASRKSRLALSASDSAAAREGLRIEADGSVARLGFFGATAVVKPTALTAAVAAAPAGGTGTAAGGWDTAGNRDLAIATINNLKTRVDQLESKLQSLGLLT